MTTTQAFEAIVAATRDLATSRGHTLGSAVVEGQFSLALRCSRCDRWINVNLPQSGDDMGVTGRGLSPCSGTPWGPLAAEPMRDDS